MKKIEGYVSKKAILFWLENYEALESGDVPYDAPPTNSGPKAFDGITGNYLNKVMLDQAIEKLPKLEKALVKARWVHKFAVKRTVTVLNITKELYYIRCKKAVDLIYNEINGERAAVKRLLEKIIK
ncbi:hypothetical protein [Cytobacillus praedii]|uniref:hypothetical protein n=1 Tax=Cytobacillus praedii TaxID=1742358 RepID=UPI002E209D41|nr:hypothetical protein [Cytobacillus praedii]